MRQTRRGSALEAVTNVAIGYWLAVGTQIAVLPWFGVRLPTHDNLLIGAVFTVVSLARSYCVRRAFNHFAERQDGRP